MSEYQLTVMGIIFGAIGALADITIVVLMILDRQRPATTPMPRRRYWPWIVALALTTAASVGPAYFIHRLINRPTAPQSRQPAGAQTAVATKNTVATSPFADDGIKWKLLAALDHDFMTYRVAGHPACEIVILHSKQKYSEQTASDLFRVIDFTKCMTRIELYSDAYPNPGSGPAGITIQTPMLDLVSDYGRSVKDELRTIANISALWAPYHMASPYMLAKHLGCNQPCIEIDIGAKP